MIATNKLRFVERKDYVKNGEVFSEPFVTTVLQQWWEFETIEKFERQTYGTPYGEWRDVPVEEKE